MASHIHLEQCLRFGGTALVFVQVRYFLTGTLAWMVSNIVSFLSMVPLSTSSPGVCATQLSGLALALAFSVNVQHSIQTALKSCKITGRHTQFPSFAFLRVHEEGRLGNK